MLRCLAWLTILLGLMVRGPGARAADGNRLTYLDSNDPYYPHAGFPKLTTPQWIGEEGVEAVVVLAIDDMRDPAKYEQYLRPILQRLKAIDGRAPVSIMTCNVKPDDPQLQAWLDEGLSIEIHTVDHPCPLLKDGDFAKAKSTYDRCVDLMHQIPHNKPVAFRMPCCDSLNTVSPRFYSEIFNATTEQGHHLSIDSSVFNVFTSEDPEIPADLILDAQGRERFKKYLPKDRTFVNTIENYPYPYVINRLCWEFPCLAPSDWSAQHHHGVNNPQTVEDWKAALDITVRKQGVMNLVFHPHGWIKAEQVVELIDHAAAKHGNKVKFLTFREALERLNRNLLEGKPIRGDRGGDDGVRLADLDGNGYVDVFWTRRRYLQKEWSPESNSWKRSEERMPLPYAGIIPPPPTFEQNHALRFAMFRVPGPHVVKEYHKPGKNITEYPIWQLGKYKTLNLQEQGWSKGHLDRHWCWSVWHGVEAGLRFRDLDDDGNAEALIANHAMNAICRYSYEKEEWQRLPISLPAGASLVARNGKDAGLRFVDVDEDGRDDVVFSNAERYDVWLWEDMETGWGQELLSGKRGEKEPKDELPPIIRADGTDNGFFVHSRHLFWQNEDTASLPDLVDRRSFDDLLRDVQPGPKSPEVSLKLMEPRPGFVVDLVAAEPLTMDPVAFDWGPDGKFWIVEMADYPLGIDGKGKPGGRVRYLEDTDGDGRYDNTTLFLDEIPYPTGVMAWRGGVLVTAAPDIFYAEDTDGDGRADKHEVLYTGFGEGNQQHRVNGLVWGLDNWIYCGNGDSGGEIRSLKTGDTVNVRGRDLRIHPDTGRLDPQTGQTQYGRSRSEWGDWFGCNNSNPAFHFALDDAYLRRNPHVAPPNPVVQISVAPGAAPVFPISRALERFNDFHTLNRFTSANSVIVYSDELFGPLFSQSTFVSEPVHNLVHREVLEPKGTTFTSRRADDEQASEFLASRDNWFRPAMVKTGPDGALWVADMYRHVIEHPQWIPQEWQERLDLRAGEDKGRIYRVYPRDAKLRPVPRLDTLTTDQLVAALDSPNGWQRDTAQRLLVERNDPAAVEPLKALARSSERPLARLHALCALDGLSGLDADLMTAAMADPHPGVRRHAVRLSEALFNRHAELGAAALKLVDDPDPQLQMQLAYSLGAWDDPRAGAALAKLARRHAEAPYLVAAALSSVNAGNLDAVLAAVLQDGGARAESPIVERLLALTAALGDAEAVARVIGMLTEPDADGAFAPGQLSGLATLLDAMDRRHVALPKGDAAGRLRAASDHAARVAADPDAEEAARLAGIGLLAHSPAKPQEIRAALAALLVPQESGAVQAAAVAALARRDDPAAAESLLAGWKGYGPQLRAAVLDALLSRGEWTRQLLASIESGAVAPADLDAARRQRLLGLKSDELRGRAERLLAGTIDANRQGVLDAYREAAAADGDPARGRRVFGRVCANCHRLNDAGHAVGPDLAGLKDKSPASLLVAILDPNRSVEAKYVNYLALTKQGQTFSGLLESETGNGITLLAAEGKRVELLRADLEELTSTAKSTMPEGLEKDLRPQDVADVITYVRASAPPPERKTFAGNSPATVTPREDGSLLLDTSTCEIYGPSIVLEETYRNLGYWSAEEDHAVWTVNVPPGGAYDVFLTFACDDSAAGNSLLVSCAGSQLTREVPGTGNWDAYRRKRFGRLQLAAGEQRLVVRSAGPIRGALIDLKSLELVPQEE